MEAAAERPASLTGTDLSAGLADLVAGLARLGPQFAIEVHPADSVADGQWRPFGELFEALDDRVAMVRAGLAAAVGRLLEDVELRVAVSMTQLGLTGRLLCPALGVAVLSGGLLDLDPAGLRWQPGPGTAIALSVPADAMSRASASGRPKAALAAAFAGQPSAGLVDPLADTVLAGPARLLVEAGSQYGVSPQVLWGNVASVVHGVRGLIAAGAPELLGPTEALVTSLLDRPPLRGTSRGGHGADFRRRSCCLIYRLAQTEPGGARGSIGICGDCVLESVTH